MHYTAKEWYCLQLSNGMHYVFKVEVCLEKLTKTFQEKKFEKQKIVKISVKMATKNHTKNQIVIEIRL